MTDSQRPTRVRLASLGLEPIDPRCAFIGARNRQFYSFLTPSMPHHSIGSISHVGGVLFSMAKDAASQLHRKRSGEATPPMSSSHTTCSIHTLSPQMSISQLPPQPGTPSQASSRSPKEIVRAISQTFTQSVSSLETHHRLHSYHHVLLKKVAQTGFTRSEVEEVRRMAGDLVEWMQ